MTKTHLITASLGGCLFLISCEPLPVGSAPQYGSDPYSREDYRQDYRPEPRPYQMPDDRYDRGRGGELPPEPQPQRVPPRDQYPSAERTDNPNQVLSPYAPYNVIDVEGFRTGQLAKDPSNGKIFRVP